MQTDAELLTSYARTRDEAAFAELARRHGGMVYRVALRVLRDPHEAEDAAQAAFAVLAIKAGSVGGKGDLAAWLHGVARRVALRLLRDRSRRARQAEELAMLKSAETSEDAAPEDREAALRALDDELAELPRGERLAVTLRHLEELSEPEAAGVLGCAVGTLSSQASKGLARLRERLSRRGVTLSGAALLGVLGSQAGMPVPATLLSSILAASKLAATGAAAGAAAGSKALALAKMEVQAMFWMKAKLVAAVVVGAAVIGGGIPLTLNAVRGGEPAVEKDAEGRIKAKDHAGREWLLEDWKEGAAKFPAPEDVAKYKEWLKDVTRPYPKDLKEREAWYLKKWGENWDGPAFARKILAPGNWKWEAIPLPEDLSKALSEPTDKMKALLSGHKPKRLSWLGSSRLSICVGDSVSS